MTSSAQTFSWSDFLEAALQLRGIVSTSPYPEALRRTVIGRAYYAAFHVAKASGTARGITYTGYGTEHDKVITSFTNSKDPALKRTAERLKRIKRYRHDADYDPAVYPPNRVDEALTFSSKILEELMVRPRTK